MAALGLARMNWREIQMNCWLLKHPLVICFPFHLLLLDWRAAQGPVTVIEVAREQGRMEEKGGKWEGEKEGK